MKLESVYQTLLTMNSPPVLYVGSCCDMLPIVNLDDEKHFVFITLEPNLPYFPVGCYGHRYSTSSTFLRVIMDQLGEEWTFKTDDMTQIPWVFVNEERVLYMYHSTSFDETLSPSIQKHIANTEKMWVSGYYPQEQFTNNYCPLIKEIYLNEFDKELDDSYTSTHYVGKNIKWCWFTGFEWVEEVNEWMTQEESEKFYDQPNNESD